MAKAKNETKYTREALLKSDVFNGYQRDFVSAILVDPYYTISEAKKLVEEYFTKEK